MFDLVLLFRNVSMSEIGELKSDKSFTNSFNGNNDINYGREIGNEALSWELSSAKPGHGMNEIRDNNFNTFWQSDGSAPHKCIIIFNKKELLSYICIYSDYKLDESYTPNHIIIKALTSIYENDIIINTELTEPNGWIKFKLKPHNRQNKYDKYLKTNKIIIEIHSSHQQGRDTHVRQIKIYSPILNRINIKNNKYLIQLINDANNISSNNDINNNKSIKMSNDDDDDMDYDDEDIKQLIPTKSSFLDELVWR